MSGTASFHDKAKAVKPHQSVKPSTYWVAVLIYGKQPETPKVEEDFLWIKCHSKITVKAILVQYYSARNVVDEDLVLKHESGFPEETASIKELDVHGDQFVAFEILPRPVAPRQPLGDRILQTPRRNSPVEKPVTPKSMPGKENRPITVMSPAALATDQSSRSTSFPVGTTISGHGPSPPLSTPYFVQQPNTTSSIATDIVQKATSAVVDDALEANRTQNSTLQNARLYESEEDSLANAQLDGQLKDHNVPPSPDDRDLGGVPTNLLPHWPVGATLPETHSMIKVEPNAESLMDPDTLAEEEQPPRNFQLQSLIADASLDVLEASVEKGVQVLEELKKPLQNNVEDDRNAKSWIEQINKLQMQAVKTKSIIGVIGATGAGKSSVINAMLEQERLVPTNCMRACTSVVTEIQYNYSETAYRAEIEFISISDWEKELKTLFEDLFDGSGQISKESTNENTDAGIAYAKIRAVYPKKTREDIAGSSIQKMLEEVSHILGSNKKIEENNSLVFYMKLQQLVDSKEKDQQKKKESKSMELWPLIRVVRIYVKAEALETGAVIVDLPGVHDSNAARAAVAEGYMKQCTGLWIVAPITRAVDDKAAKNLLGETFKRQLKMDGSFSSVTFICSKTDDISLLEAQDSLGLDEELAPAWNQLDDLERKTTVTKKEIEELKEMKATYGELIADADEQLEAWDNIREEVADGKIVYAPSTNKKRKRGAIEGQRKKPKNLSDDEEEQDYDDDASNVSSHDDANEEENQQNPLTGTDVTTTIAEIRNTRKEARRHRSELESKLRVLHKELSKISAEINRIKAHIHHTCISGRNAYSTGAIQQDFAQGIKELDQEIAAEEDEENFDPENEVRDYDEVAKSLPVFCVSSRAYSKLQGRNKKDPSVRGFETREETQIPQLIEHAKKLTVAGRTAACRRFITNLSQLLNSMTMWATNRSDGSLTKDQRATEARSLEIHLEKLETGLDELVDTTCAALKEVFGEQIYNQYANATKAAEEAAKSTANHWGLPVNRENRALGGLYCATYAAICRRNGTYSNIQAAYNWNAELIEPMIKILAPGWERTFSRKVPMVMTLSIRNAAEVLRKFHERVEARAQKVGVGIAGLHMLKQQLQLYEDQMKDLSATITALINAQQRDINREFTPNIESAMIQVYEACAQEHGTGTFMRMKSHMSSHIGRERSTMFKASTTHVERQLTKMINMVKNSMEEKMDEIYISICRDYRSVLGENEVPHRDITPRWARVMRKDLLAVIDGAEKTFREVTEVPLNEGNGAKDTNATQTQDDSTVSQIGIKVEATLDDELPVGLLSSDSDDVSC